MFYVKQKFRFNIPSIDFQGSCQEGGEKGQGREEGKRTDNNYHLQEKFQTVVRSFILIFPNVWATICLSLHSLIIHIDVLLLLL